MDDETLLEQSKPAPEPPAPAAATETAADGTAVTVKANVGCCGLPAGTTGTIAATPEVLACIDAGKLTKV